MAATPRESHRSDGFYPQCKEVKWSSTRFGFNGSCSEPRREVSLELRQVLLPRVHHVTGVVVVMLDAGQHVGRCVELRQRPVGRAVRRPEVVTSAADKDLQMR